MPTSTRHVRLSNRLTLATATVLILSLALALPCLPKSDFSEAENRALAAFPRISWQNLASGAFASGLADFYTDQFPLRRAFTALKANTERLLGAQENNGVLFGKDGYLLPRGEYDDLSVTTQNLAACRALLDRMQARGVPTVVAPVPRAVDVMRSAYPAHYDPTRANRIYACLDEALPDRVDLVTPLRAAADSGTQVYYRTDHHWTTDGAYLAYLSLCPALGVAPLPPEDFTRVCVTEDFLGTSFSKSGLLHASPDSIVLYRYEGDTAITVRNRETETEAQGFYDASALAQKDAYAVFLCGNFSHLSIRDGDPDKPTLLLCKDSFANALIPFLARHFQLEVVDPRYLATDARTLLDALAPDRVLLLYGVDTLATTRAVGKIS